VIYKQIDTDYLVLGLDPGKVNFGWATYGGEGLVDTGVVEGMDNVKGLPSFKERFGNLFHSISPNICGIERYRLRPGKGASQNMELVNILIGHVWTVCELQWVPCYLVDPSAHKSWTSRTFKVELRKQKSKAKIKKKYDLRTYEEWKHLKTEHEVDAANVAKYVYDYLLPKEKKKNGN